MAHDVCCFPEHTIQLIFVRVKEHVSMWSLFCNENTTGLVQGCAILKCKPDALLCTHWSTDGRLLVWMLDVCRSPMSPSTMTCFKGWWKLSVASWSGWVIRLIVCRLFVVFAKKANDAILLWSEYKVVISVLTLSPPIPLRLYSLPCWSNPPVLIFDIRALWRSGLSARAPECQKLKLVG